MGSLRRGVSLGEAIVAIFLIVSAVMVSVALFHNGLRYGRVAQTRVLAGAYARKVMAQARDWASDPAKFSAMSWTPFDGVDLTDPDYPGFVARVTRVDEGRDLLSPSSTLETMFLTQANVMEKSLMPVQVTVSWGEPEQTLSLTSLIGQPEHALPPNPTVTVSRSGPPDPVPSLSEVVFRAELRDAGGDPIPNVTFSWTLEPVTGNATLLQSQAPHDGSEMKLKHEYQWSPLLSPPQFGQVPGEVRLEVLCRYRGRKITNGTPVIVNLQ